jgi:hypothetical protein
MAKRRRTATRTQTKIVRMSSPAPIVRIAAPRAITRKRSRRRNGSGGHHVGGLVSNESIQMAIGGALYGFAVKSGLIAKLPAIPVLGSEGAIQGDADNADVHGDFTMGDYDSSDQ